MTTQQSPLVAEYLTLLAALLVARDKAGGELTQEAESNWVAKLDERWQAMSPAEQDEAERIGRGGVSPSWRDTLRRVREDAGVVEPPPAITGNEPACPQCGVSWQGDPIPETHREHYGSSTHFRRLIAIYDRELDRTVNYKCPDCGFIFDMA